MSHPHSVDRQPLCDRNDCSGQHGEYKNVSGPRLVYNRFGKSAVRMIKLTKVPQRDGSVRHDMREVSVRVLLEGDFGDSYITGDNSRVIPTDTQKNTVYIVGKQWTSGLIEDFAIMLARHFMSQYDAQHVSGVHVDIKETEWERIMVNGQKHNHAFTKREPYTHFCRLYVDRTNPVQLVSGVAGLTLLKTTKSGFVGYWRDQFTTLPESTDRMMRSEIHGEWSYTGAHCDRISRHIRSGRNRYSVSANTSDAVRREVQIKFSDIFQTAVDVLMRRFAGEPVHGTMSWSVQQTLYDAGVELLNKEDALDNVYLSMPNLHVYLYDLSRFGMENDNEIWWPSEEPRGVIEACVTRGGALGKLADKNKPQGPCARI